MNGYQIWLQTLPSLTLLATRFCISPTSDTTVIYWIEQYCCVSTSGFVLFVSCEDRLPLTHKDGRTPRSSTYKPIQINTELFVDKMGVTRPRLVVRSRLTEGVGQVSGVSDYRMSERWLIGLALMSEYVGGGGGGGRARGSSWRILLNLSLVGTDLPLVQIGATSVVVQHFVHANDFISSSTIVLRSCPSNGSEGSWFIPGTYVFVSFGSHLPSDWSFSSVSRLIS